MTETTVTATGPELFLSHKSDDPIAKQLFDALIDIYRLDESDIKRHIFYSGDPRSGLEFARDLSTILERLRTAKKVIGIVTPDGVEATGMWAEMALASEQKKLQPAISDKSCQRMLKWPFTNVATTKLYRHEEVRKLFLELQDQLGASPDKAKLERQSLEIARRTRRHRNFALARRMTPPILATVILGAASFFSGFYGGLNTVPSKVVPEEIAGRRVEILREDSLPAKRLQDVLYQIDASLLDKGLYSADKHTCRRAKAVELFLTALNSKHGGLDDPTLEQLRRIPWKWTTDGGTSGMDTASGRPCDSLEPVDAEWCSTLNQAISESAQLKKFDDATFAVVAVKLDALTYLGVLTERKAHRFGKAWDSSTLATEIEAGLRAASIPQEPQACPAK